MILELALLWISFVLYTELLHICFSSVEAALFFLSSKKCCISQIFKSPKGNWWTCLIIVFLETELGLTFDEVFLSSSLKIQINSFSVLKWVSAMLLCMSVCNLHLTYLFYFSVFSQGLKKSSLELYGLICYGELRKKIGGCEYEWLKIILIW